MRRLVRKVAITAIAVSMSMAVGAQDKGDMAAGGNLLLGTGNSLTNFGIGAKFLYNVTAPIRLAGEFDFFLKSKQITMWDFSVYGHYLFPVADKVVVYPAVGLGVMGAKADLGELSKIAGVKSSSSDFALSLGGGVDYALTDQLSLTGELRFKIMDGSRFILLGGIAYKF